MLTSFSKLELDASIDLMFWWL